MFEYGDKANLTVSLTIKGVRIGNKGDPVDVLAVDRSLDTDITYRVQIGERDVIVRVRALCPRGIAAGGQGPNPESDSRAHP